MPLEIKDFSTISPSAKSLLMLKAHTDIPYAKQLASLMQGGEIFDLNFDNKDFWFWIRVMHFESRYWSIDQLMKQAEANNILELSSSYSLRGLDTCDNKASIHYIDTDLPEVVSLKQKMIATLQLGKDVKGKFELLPLNAMEESTFNATVGRFDNRPLTIINEGLLMYLNNDEKKQLCANIRAALELHDGCWITADIYIRRSPEAAAIVPQSKSEVAFFEQHNLEENKFESFEGAHAFFREQGFEFVTEALPNFQSMSALPHLLKAMPEKMRDSKQPPPKIQATWMLKAV